MDSFSSCKLVLFWFHWIFYFCNYFASVAVLWSRRLTSFAASERHSTTGLGCGVDTSRAVSRLCDVSEVRGISRQVAWKPRGARRTLLHPIQRFGWVSSFLLLLSSARQLVHWSGLFVSLYCAHVELLIERIGRIGSMAVIALFTCMCIICFLYFILLIKSFGLLATRGCRFVHWGTAGIVSGCGRSSERCVCWVHARLWVSTVESSAAATGDTTSQTCLFTHVDWKHDLQRD